MNKLEYRPEIDGLRAFAVLPVVFFHAGFETFKGGFVGVDMFFVISGYLITSIIISELTEGVFSISNFYERRARRIMPALFFVMLSSLPFAWAWLTPKEIQDFAQSLIAVSLFGSNIFFWQETGYFAPSAELKPLLHTWSLAVEEQYYLLFPIFLLVSWKWGLKLIVTILALTFVISFLLANIGAHLYPSASFFLLPTRVWELVIGAFVAIYHTKFEVVLDKTISEAGGFIGLGLVIYSIIEFGQETSFTPMYPLLPTLGTALVILFCTKSTILGRFLSRRLFVGVGLISYSTYLWHQPIFAFARHRSPLELSSITFILLSALAVLLGYISWRYVEAPFRKRLEFERRHIFSLSLFGTLFFLSIGVFGNLTNGNLVNDSRLDKLDNLFIENEGLTVGCHDIKSNMVTCSNSENPEVLLWGDSYAMHLADGLVASNPNIKLVQKTAHACGSFLNIAPISTVYNRAFSEKCLAFNDEVFNFLTNSPSIKYVILSSSFKAYVGRGAKVLTDDGRVVDEQNVITDLMLETIRKVQELGKKPVLFSPLPQNGKNIGHCLKKALLFEADEDVCDINYSEALKFDSETRTFLNNIKPHIAVINISDFLCISGLCRSSINGVPIYRDEGHLSREGSAYLGSQMNFYDLVARSPKNSEYSNESYK
jgi:peptidoglycan/LPS O-acetylase OafA/YrhL